MERRIKEILIDIAKKTYNQSPSPFKLEIIPEERKSFHGDYCRQTRVIRIFNISRPVDHIISTTIHELAHHIDYDKNNSSGHNKRFYGILRDLMTSAIQCGYVDYSSIKNKKDSLDIVQMEKYYGPLVAYYDETKDTNKDKYVIQVLNSFKIKDFLKENKFKYNTIEKIWEKTININDIEETKKLVLSKDDSVEIKVLKFNEITIDTYYYVIVSKNTYNHKEELSKNGYKYKGYNEQSNSWVKKIKTTDLNKEKTFLEKLNLQYTLRH